MLNDIEIRNYWKNGYIILKNIYSTEQVARFRNIIKKQVTKDLGNESRY